MATALDLEDSYDPSDEFGVLLRRWRRQRGVSQLDLALNAGTSQRHLSFLETGRARPSRYMVVALAGALAVGSALIADTDPLWAAVAGEPAALRWARDRKLSGVAGKVRAQRLASAWAALG